MTEPLEKKITISLSGWFRIFAVILVAQWLILWLMGFLMVHKQRDLLFDLLTSRVEVLADELDVSTRTTLETGLTLAEAQGLQGLISRLKQDSAKLADIRRIDVFSLGEVSSTLFSTDAGQVKMTLAPGLEKLAGREKAYWRLEKDGVIYFGKTLRDDFGQLAGGYVFLIGTDRLEADVALAWKNLRNSMIKAGLAMLLFVPLLLWVAARLRSERLELKTQLVIISVVGLLSASLYMANTVRTDFTQLVKPEVEAKTSAVANFLAKKIERAIVMGIPYQKLTGVKEYFDDLRTRHHEVVSLSLEGPGVRYGDDPTGTLGEKAILRKQAINTADGISAEINVVAVADDRVIVRRLNELAADIGVVLLAGVVIISESLPLILAGILATAPVLAGKGAVAPATSPAKASLSFESIRLPLFLAILTEELSRAFLPLYLRDFSEQVTWLRPGTVVSLPISLYMLCFGLTTPFAGRWADTRGHSKVFSLGAAAAVAGFGLTALATTYWMVLAGRCLSAFAYATCTMACQRAILQLTDSSSRARGLALFVTVVGTAAICGGAVGGVLAMRIGYRGVFAISATIAAISWLTFAYVGQGVPHREDATPPFHIRDVVHLFWRAPMAKRIVALMVGAVMPAKLVLAGFLFYLTPLALRNVGYSTAAIGRAMMLYFILVAVFNTMASWLADRFRLRISMVLLGGVVIGLVGLGGILSGAGAILFGIVCLGVGTGIGAAALQALASETGSHDGVVGTTSVAVITRTMERLGAFVGPLYASALVGYLSFRGAMNGIGGLVIVATLLLAATWALTAKGGQEN